MSAYKAFRFAEEHRCCIRGNGYAFSDKGREYVHELLDFGYRQVPKEEYTEQEAIVAGDSLACFIFTLPSVRCIVCVHYDEEMDTKALSMTLRFDGRYNNFFGL